MKLLRKVYEIRRRSLKFLMTPFGIVLVFLTIGASVALGMLQADDGTRQVSQSAESEQISPAGVVDTPSDDQANPSGQGGSSLSGNVSGLLSSVVSTRNLDGILVQINQIDTCSAPDIDAYISITDKDGSLFRDVREGDFTLKVDGEEVTDFVFRPIDPDGNNLTTSMALDRSGSMKGDPIAQLKTAANTYVDQARKLDQIGIVGFASNVEVLSQVTAKKTDLKPLISGMKAEGNTTLYDATIKATDIAPDCGRKAAIIMSDGEDTSSSANLERTIGVANKASMPLFVVGLKAPTYQPDVLERIAQETGALYFDAPSPSELTTIYQTINEQLSKQYQFELKLPLTKQNKERTLEIILNRGSKSSSTRSFVY